MGVRGQTTRLKQCLLDRLEILEDFVVPKPDDAPALAFKKLGSPFIGALSCEMRFPVQFNKQSAGDAGEVSNVGTDRILSAKLEARKSAVTKETPEQCLGRDLVLPQFARPADSSWVSGHRVCNSPSPPAPLPRRCWARARLLSLKAGGRGAEVENRPPPPSPAMPTHKFTSPIHPLCYPN
jgi:hypothetical protein